MARVALTNLPVNGTGVDAIQLDTQFNALQTGINSVDSTQLVAANLLGQMGWFSVRDYGAIGNGTTDDTAAIGNAIIGAQAAVAAGLGLSGATILFPPGLYKVTAGFTITSNAVSFAGMGRKTSTINFTAPSAGQTLFTFGAINGNTVRDLYIGCGGSFQTSATAFTLNATTDFEIRGCDITGFACAFSMVDVNVFFASALGVTQGANAQLDCILLDGVVQRSTSSGLLINGCVEIHFTDVGLGTTGTSTVAGWHFRACDGVWLTACDTLNFNYALLIDPATTIASVRKSVGELFFVACDFDVSVTNSVAIQPGQQGTAANIQFTGGRHASLGGTASSINAATATSVVIGIQYINCGFQLALTGYGGSVTNTGAGTVQDITYLCCLIAGNTSGGINVGAAVDGVLISGCKFRPVAAFYTSTQPYAVTANTLATNVVIEACDLRGQATAPLNVASTDGSLRVRRNIGDTYVASNPAFSTGVAWTNNTGHDLMLFITGGTVSQTALAGVTTNLTSGSFRIPAGRTFTLTYSSAPTLATVAETT